ncbi:MAG: response regulator [Chloroflexaceae bacterium]|nr:response regulator [Chloroflexaceae bacterium]
MTTLLLIDNDVALLARLDSQLTEAGYRVVKTSEAAPAHHLLSEMGPDLVLLEVKTGRGAGWDLLAEFAPRVPVFVLSSEGREEDVVRGFELGAVEYLAKPYRSGELLARLQARLRRAEVRPAAPHGNRNSNGHTPPAFVDDLGELTAAPAFVDDLGELTAAPSEAYATPPILPYTASAPAAEVAPPSAARRKQEEQVFMSDHEELALLRTPVPEQPAAAAVVSDDASLGRRMWAERQRRRLTLVQVENDLHIRMWYLQAMEEEQFTLLPRGPAVVQMIRSYATYLGLNANEAVTEYQEHFASALQPEAVPAFPPKRSLRVPRWVFSLLAVVLATIVSIGVIYWLDPEIIERTLSLIRAWIPFKSLFNNPTPGDLVLEPAGRS